MAEYVKESEGRLQMGNLPGTVQALVPKWSSGHFDYNETTSERRHRFRSLFQLLHIFARHCFDMFWLFPFLVQGIFLAPEPRNPGLWASACSDRFMPNDAPVNGLGQFMSSNNLFIHCVIKSFIQRSLCVIKRIQTLQGWRHFGPGNLSTIAAAASSRHDELPGRFRRMLWNALKYTMTIMVFSESPGIVTTPFLRHALSWFCVFGYLGTLKSKHQRWLTNLQSVQLCMSVGSAYLLCYFNAPFLTMNGDHGCMCNTFFLGA